MLYGTYMLLLPFQNLHTAVYKQQQRLERNTAAAAAAAGGVVVVDINNTVRTIERISPYMPHRDEKMLITISFMLCVALAISIACLGGFHIYLTLTAQTTIEFHGNYMNRRQARRYHEKPWKNPYDQGWRKNWQQVFGPSTSIWQIIVPSRRVPEFLPVPMPGVNTQRKKI
jgi:hypothetical protein